MKNYAAENVDQYIAGAVPGARPKLEELRRLIKKTVPEAEESISWGVPFYKYYGLLTGLASFDHHVTFGLAFRISDEDRARLEEDGYKTGSKTVQIKFDQDMPQTIIVKMLKNRAAENMLKKKVK